jgi:hypothetical protein
VRQGCGVTRDEPELEDPEEIRLGVAHVPVRAFRADGDDGFTAAAPAID